jgi:hypothetical protein
MWPLFRGVVKAGLAVVLILMCLKTNQNMHLKFIFFRVYTHELELECVGFLSFRDETRFAIGRRMASHSPGSAFLRNRDDIADFEFETTSN